MYIQQEEVKRGKTGRGYKITRFSAEFAEKNNHGRYYLALFNKDELKSHDGWYADNFRHVKEDGEAFIALNTEKKKTSATINKIMDELHKAKIKIDIDEEPEQHISAALDMLETLSMEM